MESLGYGTHLIIDGFKGQAAYLGERAQAERLLQDIAALLEPRNAKPPAVLLESCGAPTPGLSAALLQAEAYVTLHTFTEMQAASLTVFSRHGSDLGSLTERLEAFYGLRRFESHLKNHARTMVKDLERRRRTLLGDRQYAALRLQDQVVL